VPFRKHMQKGISKVLTEQTELPARGVDRPGGRAVVVAQRKGCTMWLADGVGVGASMAARCANYQLGVTVEITDILQRVRNADDARKASSCSFCRWPSIHI
jgi:hypothetical protein